MSDIDRRYVDLLGRIEANAHRVVDERNEGDIAALEAIGLAEECLAAMVRAGAGIDAIAPRVETLALIIRDRAARHAADGKVSSPRFLYREPSRHAITRIVPMTDAAKGLAAAMPATVFTSDPDSLRRELDDVFAALGGSPPVRSEERTVDVPTTGR